MAKVDKVMGEERLVFFDSDVLVLRDLLVYGNAGKDKLEQTAAIQRLVKAQAAAVEKRTAPETQGEQLVRAATRDLGIMAKEFCGIPEHQVAAAVRRLLYYSLLPVELLHAQLTEHEQALVSEQEMAAIVAWMSADKMVSFAEYHRRTKAWEEAEPPRTKGLERFKPDDWHPFVTTPNNGPCSSCGQAHSAAIHRKRTS